MIGQNIFYINKLTSEDTMKTIKERDDKALMEVSDDVSYYLHNIIHSYCII